MTSPAYLPKHKATLEFVTTWQVRNQRGVQLLDNILDAVRSDKKVGHYDSLVANCWTDLEILDHLCCTESLDGEKAVKMVFPSPAAAVREMRKTQKLVNEYAEEIQSTAW